MKKYRAQFDEIDVVEVTRETAKFVVLRSAIGGEYKDAKESDWRGYFDTWKEAQKFLVDIATQFNDDARKTFERTTAVLEKIKSLKRP